MKITPLAQNSSVILSHLQKVRRLGDGRYIALCPCHDDRNPSLSVTVKPDGGVLIYCPACGAKGTDVCRTLSIEVSALFPPSDTPKCEKQSRSGFSAWQLLHGLKDDLVRLLVVANAMKSISALSGEDRDFVSSLVIRINEGISHLEGTHQ